TCLVDQLSPSVGVSTVEVLRRAGCTVEFNERQTCCGQLAFTTGYRQEARQLAERFIELYEASLADAIVIPSGSCAAMVHHFVELFPADERWRARASAIAPVSAVHKIFGRLPEQRKLTPIHLLVINRADCVAGFRKRGTFEPSLFRQAFQTDEQRISGKSRR